MRTNTLHNGLVPWTAGRFLGAAVAFVFTMSSTTWAVEIETETREVTGIGKTLQVAITEGLLEAIGQVSGRMLETETAMRSVEVSVTDGPAEDYYASEEFQKKVNSATKGAVQQYSILEQATNELGLYEVKLSVMCLKVVPDVDGRKKLVCATFPCKGAAQPELFGPGGALPSGVFMDSLESAFVQTRKFAVLDRRETDAVAREQNIVLSGNVPIEDVLRMSMDNPTDLVVVGGIDAVDYKVTQRTMPSGRVITVGEGLVEINFRVVDVPSKRVKYADRVRYSYDDQTLRELSGSLTVNRPGNLMLTDASRRICKQILEAIYPARVIKVVGDTVTLNEGGQGVEVDQIYDVFAVGRICSTPIPRRNLGRQKPLWEKSKLFRVRPRWRPEPLWRNQATSRRGAFAALPRSKTLGLSLPLQSREKNLARTIFFKQTEGAYNETHRRQINSCVGGVALGF